MKQSQLSEELKDRYARLAGAVSSSEKPLLSKTELCEILLRIEHEASVFRTEAVGFLNERAAAGVDDALIRDTKRHIHTDVGRVLTKTRMFLEETKESVFQEDTCLQAGQELLSEWREILSSLQSGTWRREEADAFKQITEAAQAAGLRVVFQNAPPEEEAELSMYVKEAAAKIIQAMREGTDTVIL